MLRDIVIRATLNELIGDETYELWLKEGEGAWALEQTGDVADTGTQDFELVGLTEGTEYVAQIRFKREGRYRAGYLTADPDTWPAQSRLEFMPGLSSSFGAPVIDAAEWSRTSGLSQKVSVDVTPDDLAVDIELLRDGVVVATALAPHGGPITIDDVDPLQGAYHNYTARHTDGSSFGPSSNTLAVWPGPQPPSAVDIAIDVGHLAKYDVTWTASPYAGAGVVTYAVSVSSDAPGPWTTEISDAASPASGVEAECPTDLTEIYARVRTKVTQFSVDDYSEYVESVDSVAPNCP